MNYYIQKEIVKRDDDEPAEIYVLYGDGCKIGYVRYIDYKDNGRHGYVRYIDYKDNGRHGYGIRAVNEELLQMFQSEIKNQFPNSENPYIRFLDTLFPTK